MFDSDATPNDFTVGQRVRVHPSTDAWMRGLRYAEVITLGHKLVHVHFDRLPKHVVTPINPRNIAVLED